MAHMTLVVGESVYSIVYAIHPKPHTIRKAIDLAHGIEPGLSVSYRDSATFAWYRVTKLAESNGEEH